MARRVKGDAVHSVKGQAPRTAEISESSKHVDERRGAPYGDDMRRNTPQEKKQLSLQKDRRNSYGENDKASRKAIPAAKARVNRANRRADTVALTESLGAPDEDVAAASEDAVEGRRRKVWRKWPDEPLGKMLARRTDNDEQRPFDPSWRNPY
ncbi:hypothetical protein GCM10022273_27030 [Cellulomonas soli]